MTQTHKIATPLYGDRILITRPQSKLAALKEQLSQHGALAIEMPCLAIEPVTEQDAQYLVLKQQILDLDLFDIVICVSVSAAKLAGELIDQYWPQLPINIKWLAIGEATAKALAEYDIRACVARGLHQSEDLLNHAELQSIADKKILILKGSSGRELLSNTLKERFANVSEATLYNRSIPVYTDLQVNEKLYLSKLSAILITSGDALKNLMTIAKGKQRQFNSDALFCIKLFVPSQRVADIAFNLGFQSVIIVNAADNQSMLAKLISVKNLER